MLPKIVEKMPWPPSFEINHQHKFIELDPNQKETGASLTEGFEKLLHESRERKIFAVLKGWRNELYHIIGGKVSIDLERAGAVLFGIITLGVHMTAYTSTPNGMKIWVPRRSPTKETFGGMLDNTVAGGISSGETPLECLIRESAEEASLPEEYVRQKVQCCGTISYFYVRGERAGGEVGLMQPEVQYVYDLALSQDMTPKPSDNEVQEFYLLSVEEVQEALSNEEFKPNCALVILDFFVRHGIITPENEKEYAALVSRLHRKLPFPLP